MLWVCCIGGVIDGGSICGDGFICWGAVFGGGVICCGAVGDGGVIGCRIVCCCVGASSFVGVGWVIGCWPLIVPDGGDDDDVSDGLERITSSTGRTVKVPPVARWIIATSGPRLMVIACCAP